MKIKKLMPMDAESRRLIDWMEKGITLNLSSLSSIPLAQELIHNLFFPFCIGVYDALQKKYLKTLLFCVCEAVDGPMIEEYSCKSSRSYYFQRKTSYTKEFSNYVNDG